MDATELLEQHELKATPARLAVLGALMASDNAMAHQEIVKQLASKTEFDRVTIYRVLDWLLEHALIHKVPSEDRSWKFQVSSSSEKHAHLQCSNCGKTVCLHEDVPQFSSEFIQKYQVDAIDINVKGKCDSCR